MNLVCVRFSGGRVETIILIIQIEFQLIWQNLNLNSLHFNIFFKLHMMI